MIHLEYHMPPPGIKGTRAHGPRNKREKVDRRPPWTTDTFKDMRKDTKLMKQVKQCIEVHDSPVHGKGVFATDVIPRGKIAWYRGPIWSCCQSGGSGKYKMRFRDGKNVNPAVNRGNHWTKYINDARGTGAENNLYIGKDASIHSTREIQPGEELFLDYGDNYWSIPR